MIWGSHNIRNGIRRLQRWEGGEPQAGMKPCRAPQKLEDAEPALPSEPLAGGWFSLILSEARAHQFLTFELLATRILKVCCFKPISLC